MKKNSTFCVKCNDIIQEAAKNNIRKKKLEILRKYGKNSPQASEEIISDPFVVMWVPAPEEQKPQYCCMPRDPNNLEYDFSYYLNDGTGEVAPRLVKRRIC